MSLLEVLGGDAGEVEGAGAMDQEEGEEDQGGEGERSPQRIHGEREREEER